MKIKLTIIMLATALVFIAGAFAFPTTAHASPNADPPTVEASITGHTLRIEATNGFYGVEAVFINEQRFNYRVDGTLTLDVRDFADEGELFSVYAIDFAGNKSNVVWLDSPITSSEAPTQPTTPPEPPRQSNPFTPDGQASVLDQATSDDEKDFFTFTTPAGNVFHLIIDHQRNGENVYFLSAVTETDLIALAEKSGNSVNTGAIPNPPTAPTEEFPEPQEPEPETPPERQSNNGTMIFLLIAVGAAGGIGYYFKIVKPKQQRANDADYDDDGEDEDDYGDEVDFDGGYDDDEQEAE